MNEEAIFRTIIHALRHDPWKYELDLDAEGFVAFEDLVTGLRFDRYSWALLESADVERVVSSLGSSRLDLQQGRIRATYGHSIALGSLPPVVVPPEFLFHGTTNEASSLILAHGLNPGGRRFVHLSSDREYAARVASTKGGDSVLLVSASRAHEVGTQFRRANEHVWLADKVEPEFVSDSSALSRS